MSLGVTGVLSCFRDGMGMFSEAYTLFSVGNLKPIFAQAYPKCWSKNQTFDNECAEQLRASITYTEISGVICGMILIGLMADVLGRRKGSILTSVCMLIGSIMLVAADGPTEAGIFEMYTIALFVFGFGVGGEYPLAASSAAEKAQAARAKAVQKANNEGYRSAATTESAPLLQKEVKQNRGTAVVLTFSMQGAGNWFNCMVILLLLLAFGQTGKDLDKESLKYVWRIQYGIATLILLVLTIYRFVGLEESETWQAAKNKRDSEGGTINRGLFFKTYWHRLVGSAFGWLVWDITFYGNKLFQSQFISVIIGKDASVFDNLKWTFVNSSVAFAGYYFAAATIDKAWMGRMRMQLMGFFWIFVLFLAGGIWYHQLILPDLIQVFQFIYFFSSFWGQWGPNATTWLIPSELFPTETRTFAHGISAAMGKVGALISGITLNLVTDPADRFYISAGCGLAGLILTYMFIPNVTQLDLAENDRYWEAVKSKKTQQYRGEYNNPKNLSVYERISGAVPAADEFSSKTLN